MRISDWSSDVCSSDLLDELVAENVRLRVIGDYRRFGTDLTEMIDGAIARTAANTGATLVIALNYGEHAEMAAAVPPPCVRPGAGDLGRVAMDEETHTAALAHPLLAADHLSTNTHR